MNGWGTKNNLGGGGGGDDSADIRADRLELGDPQPPDFTFTAIFKINGVAAPLPPGTEYVVVFNQTNDVGVDPNTITRYEWGFTSAYNNAGKLDYIARKIT